MKNFKKFYEFIKMYLYLEYFDLKKIENQISYPNTLPYINK